MNEDDEARPLLTNEATAAQPASASTSVNSGWTTNNYPTGSTITCRICQHEVDISDKRDQHVIKCENCNEATPIRVPPPGKKYVRCPCNCLLVCRSTSRKIACPRGNCKRVITLTPDSVDALVPAGMVQVMCCHCRDTFLFSQLVNTLARCPHCRKLSSVGTRFTRRKGAISLGAALLMLIIGIIFSTTAHFTGYLIVAVGAFLLTVLLGIRGIYYLTMPISDIEVSNA